MKEILDIVNTTGVVGLLLVILVGGQKRWWVWGWLYDQKDRSEAEWRELALRGTDLAERAAELPPRRRSGR